MAKQIKKDDIKIQIKTGTARDMLVSWKFDYTPEKNIASYDWEWSPYSNNQWLSSQKGSTDHPFLTAEFTAPDDAKEIKFRVRPVSKTNKDSDLSGVDDNSDSGSTTKHYFQGSWSDWQHFKDWHKVTVPPDFSVAKISFKKVSATGGGYDLRAAHSVAKAKYEPHLPFLSGFEYQWQGWDGRDWTNIEGTVDSIYNGNTVVEPEKASSGTVELKESHKTLIRGGATLTVYHKVHLQSNFKSYRITITPVPSNEYDFLPIEKTATKSITTPVKQLKPDQIFVKTRFDNDTTYVYWFVTDKNFFEDENEVKTVSGFELQWQYAKDINVWGGGLPSGDYWENGETAVNIDVEDRVEYVTEVDVPDKATAITDNIVQKVETIKTKGNIGTGSGSSTVTDIVDKGLARSVITAAFGGKSKSLKAMKTVRMNAYQWTYAFTLPEGIKRDTAARVRIKVLASESATFTEEWSSWVDCTRVVVGEDQDSVVAHLYSTTTSARKFEALWTKFNPTNISGFDYRWYYKIANDNIYRDGASGTVDFTETTVGVVKKEDIKNQNGGYSVYPDMTLEELRASDMYKWMTSYEAPTEAVSVFFEMSCIPEYEGAFTPAIHRANTDISIPTKRITDVKIRVEDPANRTLLAYWTPIVDEHLQSYECIWEYYSKNIWLEGQTGSTSKTSVKDMQGDLITVPYSTFPVPNNITDIYGEEVTAICVRFAVRPVADNENVFKGDWGDYWRFPVIPEHLKPNDGSIYLRRESKTSRGLIASYTQKGGLPKEVEEVTFEWSYYKSGEWILMVENDTVPKDYSISQQDIPEDAEKVRVRLKPNIDTIQYIGEWSSYQEINTIPEPMTLDEDFITVAPFRGADRSVIARWVNTGNPYELENYSVRWRYYLSGAWVYDNPEGSDVSIEDSLAIYQVPENVYLITFEVKPNPKYEMDFKGEWSSKISLQVQDDTTPEVPSAPSLELKKDTNMFEISLDCYDKNTVKIRFEVVDDSTNSVWCNVEAAVLFNRVRYTFYGLPGHGYKVRAIGINADGRTMGDIGETGEDGWSQYSSIVYARPEAPSFTSITAVSESSILVEFTEVRDADSYELEYAKKSAYFDTGGPVTNTTSRINMINLVDIDSDTYYFRVRAVSDNGGNSDWSTIASGACGKVPKPPTTWSSRLNGTIGSDIYLYWTHNSEDGSKERYAEIELTVNGTVLEPIVKEKPETDTTQSSYKIPTEYVENAGVIQWRVRTKGIEEMGYGDWSTQRMIKIYAQPVVGISLANNNTWNWDDFNFNEDNIYSAEGNRNLLIRNVVESFPILIYLDAGPASQTPVAYTLTITSNNTYETSDVVGNAKRVANGQVIFNRYLNTNKSSLVTMLMPGDIDLENGMSYTLRVTLAMDSGLTAEASVIFSTAFSVGEYDIDAEIGLNRRDLIAYVTPFCNDEDGVRVSDVSLSVYRKEFDGGFTLLAEGLSGGERTTVTDPHPNLDYARYRIVARSNTTGKTEYYDIPGYPVGETSIILQWDETQVSYDAMNLDERDQAVRAGSLIRLPYNVDTTDSNQVDVEMVEYIGRSHPVSYFGTQVGQKATWNAVIPKTDKQTIYDLRRLARYMGNVYVREPSGTGYWAHVEVSFNLTHLETTVPVSISVIRVEGGM